nr:uncharacterized protein LOC107375491 [Nothobranchius furzeri]
MFRMGEEQTWRAADGDRTRTRVDLHRQPSKPRTNWRSVSGLTVCFAVSLLCLGVCVFVIVRSSEMKSRIVSLEQQRDAWMLSREQVEPLVLGQLERILEEKLAARLPKSREARDVLHGCLCPPGRVSSCPPFPCLTFTL